MDGDIMEIRAKSKYDFETVKALSHLLFYKKNNPKKSLISTVVLFSIFSVIIIVEIIVFKAYLLLVIALVLNAIFILCNFLIYYIFPKYQYKLLGKMQGVVNEYIFGDSKLKVYSKGEQYNAETEVEYSLFVNVYETSKYFFLYQTQNQVYVIDKYTIEGGSAEDIKSKIIPFLRDKYIVCKY